MAHLRQSPDIKPAERARALHGGVLRGHDLSTFLTFIAVGGAAFAVNYAALYVFYDSPIASLLPGKDDAIRLLFVEHPDARLLVASVLAVEAAIVFKFIIHEWWTFRAHAAEGWIVWRFVQFDVSAIIAAIAPLATVNVLSAAAGVSPYIGMFAGVLAGFVINWLWSAHVIWPSRRHAGAEPR